MKYYDSIHTLLISNYEYYYEYIKDQSIITEFACDIRIFLINLSFQNID